MDTLAHQMPLLHPVPVHDADPHTATQTQPLTRTRTLPQHPRRIDSVPPENRSRLQQRNR
ncbi:hypothetical protein CH063_14094, partial [Colletotrichum higginsianum]